MCIYYSSTENLVYAAMPKDSKQDKKVVRKKFKNSKMSLVARESVRIAL